MIEYSSLFDTVLKDPSLKWILEFHSHLREKFNHGDFPKWNNVLNLMPNITAQHFNFNNDAVMIGNDKALDSETSNLIYLNLKQIMPWRKGPFNIYGTYIDSEWRSNLKWDRVKNEISNLSDKIVLDIGCGNGYYGWRMLGRNAKMVIGVDPYLLSVVQFFAAKMFLPQIPFWVLPFGIENLPYDVHSFDTVFSMGIFYHRRSPFDHLLKLKTFLKENGELVLETLVIDGKNGEVLVPEKRYAKMRNVWFIPSALTLEHWLKRCGYKNIRLVDVTATTEEEQRQTEWMNYESLVNFTSKSDPKLTIEGYPSPKRAVFIAN